MCVPVDKPYIFINPLWTLAPHKNGLNTVFKPFFLRYITVARGLIIHDLELQMGINLVSGGNRL